MACGLRLVTPQYGLGLDGLQAGNITELVVVVGLCLGWISTYLWRVGNKEMTYAKQLRDYEQAVMEVRSLSHYPRCSCYQRV